MVAEDSKFPVREVDAEGRECGPKTEAATGALEGSFAPSARVSPLL